MSENLGRNKPDKFFFTTHVFDEEEDDEEIIEENLPPPPPVFSEEELEQAKQEAYALGKQDGLNESLQSQKEKISVALQVISQNINSVFEQEHQREKLFESEAVSLTLKIFQRIFPFYCKENGLTEMMEVMKEKLSDQQGQKKITVQIHPDAAPGVESFLKKIETRYTETAFEVAADHEMALASCKLSWENGGAIYDLEDLAQKIEEDLTQRLAGRGTKGHDKNEETGSASPDPEQPHEQQQPHESSQENQQDNKGETT